MPSAEGPAVTNGKLVLGLGCERNAAPAEVIALVERALAETGAGGSDLTLIATLDARSEEPAIHAAARHFAVPLRFFDAATLEAEADRLQNPSEVVFAHTGCHGVAEGAALAGAGPGAVLIVPKMRSTRATAAIAGPPSAAAAEDGQARGGAMLCTGRGTRT
ncbi:cobalt-precorrin 5A hydrolase [Sinorhizobium kostiense]|uniref:Cobalt-precorrin 5A hydrolase n=1 Tax=Sinorhizobium kostiense TaxID=76747 RepID=A0ABS4R621_9HYPH|nr:cobalamin biosynthesis protein [Sinorhizobium kostiense]MBP2238341.1 cobalt-precorrin 5A hydrolase [Sinorhizobium kostiense]